jgi:hypothetical protein
VAQKRFRTQFEAQEYKRTHAGDRAEERYGKRPTTREFEDIRSYIVQGKARLVEDNVIKQVYEVVFRGGPAWVVYNSVTRRVVTFLPKNPLQDKKP